MQFSASNITERSLRWGCIHVTNCELGLNFCYRFVRVVTPRRRFPNGIRVLQVGDLLGYRLNGAIDQS
jgi:hypothetical protein